MLFKVDSIGFVEERGSKLPKEASKLSKHATIASFLLFDFPLVGSLVNHAGDSMSSVGTLELAPVDSGDQVSSND